MLQIFYLLVVQLVRGEVEIDKEGENLDPLSSLESHRVNLKP